MVTHKTENAYFHTHIDKLSIGLRRCGLDNLDLDVGSKVKSAFINIFFMYSNCSLNSIVDIMTVSVISRMFLNNCFRISIFFWFTCNYRVNF